MIVLAFDTATPETVVALGPGDAVERRHTPGDGERPGHASQLLGLCEEALVAAGRRWEDVERIGVGVGPGTFTGLRIGVATARALAQSCGAELVAVSTLEALARGAGAADGSAVLACLDARRGEAFTAGWCDGAAVHPPAATRPESLAALAGPGWLVVGDGAIRFRTELEVAGASVPPDDDGRHRVGGMALVALAVAATPTDRDALVPHYVRAPDAQERPR